MTPDMLKGGTAGIFGVQILPGPKKGSAGCLQIQVFSNRKLRTLLVGPDALH